MNNNLKLIILVLFSIISTTLFAQKADDIIGKYHLPNKLDIEIYKVDSTYSGKIIALNGYKNGKTTDYKNPNKSKRNEALIGKIIINGLSFNKDIKQWVNAKMYGPDKGIMLNLKVTKIKDKEIVVVGSKLLFWKTLVWQKIIK